MHRKSLPLGIDGLKRAYYDIRKYLGFFAEYSMDLM
jgi:hypothetical protein